MPIPYSILLIHTEGQTLKYIGVSQLEAGELMSARTFGNNKSDYVWIRMITFIYRSCLRDRCYTTEHKVNNDTWLLCAKVMQSG